VTGTAGRFYRVWLACFWEWRPGSLRTFGCERAYNWAGS